ncbi:MAG: hypothetical protein DDT25_00937 [Chloroflexi bacterium]|nr:hypothetical protein [Chloroflexota bacterium]
MLITVTIAPPAMKDVHGLAYDGAGIVFYLKSFPTQHRFCYFTALGDGQHLKYLLGGQWPSHSSVFDDAAVNQMPDNLAPGKQDL